MCEDSISRQAAIDIITTEGTRLERNGTVAMAEIKQWCIDLLQALPSVSEPDEWCYECREYDVEHHCCHRFNKVIRKTLDDFREENGIVLCKDCKKHNVIIGERNEICPMIEHRGLAQGHEFDYQYCYYGEREEKT